MWLSNYCLLLVTKEKNKSKVELPDKKDVKSTEASNVFARLPGNYTTYNMTNHSSFSHINWKNLTEV